MRELHSDDRTHLVIAAVSSTGIRMLSDHRLKALLQGLAREFESEFCPVCGWKHGLAFHEIQFPDGRKISLPHAPARLVQLLHSARENGNIWVEIKGDPVKAICGGYHHPCKLFGDLGRKEEYKLLIDTSSRGFISLRKYPLITSRKQSQSIRNDELLSHRDNGGK